MDIRYKGYIIEENKNLGIRKSRCDVELNIKEITLLSEEEVETFLSREQRSGRDYWWLRSAYSDDSCYASLVIECGGLGYGLVYDDDIGIVPALRISNLKTLELNIGDKISVGGETWAVISNDLVLCERVVGKTAFRKEHKVPDANVYEKSDVKIWLDQWALERGIVTQENMELFHTR